MEYALLDEDHCQAHHRPHHRTITRIVQVSATIAFVLVIVTGLEMGIRDVNSSLQHTDAMNQAIFAQLRNQLGQLNHSLRGTVEGLETDIRDVNGSLQHSNDVNQAIFESLRNRDDLLRSQLGQLNHSLTGTVEGLETDIRDVNGSLQHSIVLNQATFESLRNSDDQLRNQLGQLNSRQCRICSQVTGPVYSCEGICECNTECSGWSGSASWSADRRWYLLGDRGPGNMCYQRFLLQCQTPASE